MKQKFCMIEIVTRPDGTIGLGNTVEMTEAEGTAAILQGSHCAEGYSIGVVPSSWNVEVRKEKENGRSTKL